MTKKEMLIEIHRHYRGKANTESRFFKRDMIKPKAQIEKLYNHVMEQRAIK